MREMKRSNHTRGAPRIPADHRCAELLVFKLKLIFDFALLLRLERLIRGEEKCSLTTLKRVVNVKRLGPAVRQGSDKRGLRDNTRQRF